MNNKRYTWILYVIVLVILSTIAIQVYWNYKNYLNNKQQLINDVQLSLDDAVEAYYASLAEQNTMAFAFESNLNNPSDSIIVSGLDKIKHRIQKNDTTHNHSDSINISIVSIAKGDTVFRNIHDSIPNQLIKTFKKEISLDSITHDNFRMLTSKVVFAMANDSLQLETIDSIFVNQLLQKGLELDYGLKYQCFTDTPNYINKKITESATLNAISKSPFIHEGTNLSVYFINETKIILKRILSGILISTLLVLAVISCLFYLLKIIKHQKQLAEVKNDLISNITHEFKTPIATIGVAIESIKNFDVLNDKEKTKSYLNMSNEQLSKLNIMVEKLLETATLDSENLELKKDIINIHELLSNLIDKHKIQLDSKTIDYNSISDNVMAKVDIFHFENAINNIIDNAIKYGGNLISIQLSQNSNSFNVSISDNGNTLTKTNKEKIFEKFYRIPKGNTHDVKGFGIGLYYTKKIIEKHNGTIRLDLNNNHTTFNISIPNE